jgi:phenylacetate-CoA ligase
MVTLISKTLNTAYVIPACIWEKRAPYASPVLLGALRQFRFRAIVRHAWRHVPFYRQAMEERGLKPADLREPEDLEQLPLISNEDLRKNPSSFHSVSRNSRTDMLIRAGNYKNIYWSRRAALQWFARISRSRDVLNNLLGRKSGYTEVYINSPVSSNSEMNRYWSGNLLFKGRASGMFRLDINDSYEKIVDEVNRIRPDILYCFGSYAEHLVKFIHNRGLVFCAPAIWVYGSDMMSSGIREFIEEKFGCLVYSAYNMNEMGAMSFECENRDGYHLNTDACYVRIADEDGSTVQEGDPGEVVISNLVNTSTVILNYRTGDRGNMVGAPCTCGRSLPLLKNLYGRISDTIYCADGMNISFGQLDAQVGALMSDVALYQVVQDRPGHICWHLVPLPQCDRDSVERLLEKLMEKTVLFPNDIEIRWVDKIEMTQGQKRKFVIHRFN